MARKPKVWYPSEQQLSSLKNQAYSYGMQAAISSKDITFSDTASMMADKIQAMIVAAECDSYYESLLDVLADSFELGRTTGSKTWHVN
jgi:hypothetical protein